MKRGSKRNGGRPPKIRPGKLAIGLRELDWLAGAIGLHSMPERPALKELVRRLPSLTLLSYPHGTDIVREGDVSTDFFVLYRGRTQVLKGFKRVAELVPGDFFGEVGFLVQVPRTATVRAEGPCEAFRLRGADFEKVLLRVKGLDALLRDVARQRMRKLAEAAKHA